MPLLLDVLFKLLWMRDAGCTRGKDRLAAPFVVSLFVITGVLVMRVYVCACVRMTGLKGRSQIIQRGREYFSSLITNGCLQSTVLLED